MSAKPANNVMERIPRGFSKNIKLNKVPTGKVMICIPDVYINRITGEVNLEAFSVYIDSAPNITIIYEDSKGHK